MLEFTFHISNQTESFAGIYRVQKQQEMMNSDDAAVVILIGKPVSLLKISCPSLSSIALLYDSLWPFINIYNIYSI